MDSIGTLSIDVLDEPLLILLIKSIVHEKSEEEKVLKDLLFLVVVKTKSIHFSGLGKFHITLENSQIQKILENGEEIPNWNTHIKIESGDFRFIFENVERLKKEYTLLHPTRDHFCLFFLSCLELYNLDSEYYPLYKWLFNLHFKTHD